MSQFSDDQTSSARKRGSSYRMLTCFELDPQSSPPESRFTAAEMIGRSVRSTAVTRRIWRGWRRGVLGFVAGTVVHDLTLAVHDPSARSSSVTHRVE